MNLSNASDVIVKKTDEFRQSKGLPALNVSEDLKKAASKFADFMAETEKYGHQADGRTPAQRAEAAGYDYCAVRENIAYRTDPTELDAKQLADYFTQGWIDSPGHRENMLAEYVTETGVAIATTDGTTFFAVQLFGRPRSQSYKVEVANKADQTFTLQLKSNDASDEIEIPPRGILKLRRCFPMTMILRTLEESDEESDEVGRIEVNEETELTIQNIDGETRWTKAETEAKQ